jgi:long-chain acyl-CoA synthetase
LSIIEHARNTPDKAAVIMAESGARLSYAELNDASARLASVLRGSLDEGDRVAILMENRPEYYIACWAARRAGLRYVPINWHLTADEAGYVIADCDARAIVASASLIELAIRACAGAPAVELKITVDAADQGFLALSALTAQASPQPADQEREGALMAYSSGTSGKPKGILRALPDRPFGQPIDFERMIEPNYGIGPDAIYLSPAPLYHTAPIGWSTATQSVGGTVVLMESFDAENTLKAIERYRVTHAQFVPTHFIRLLKLPEDVRRRYDHSSLQMVIHAAAPCPAEVKRAMIEWWGSIIYEYYAGSEGGGFFALTSEEWLAHPGSVGRMVGGIGGGGKTPIESSTHIVDLETGAEVAPGEIGLIYFENAARFEYHKDPGKTAEFFNDAGWGTLGDMGWLDPDGFLYLADRKSHMIISGGVNIYPQEAEAVLALHPRVADVGVIGVPNAEFGEEVKAVVQPVGEGSPALASELIAYCRERLAGYKCPRTVDFVEALPRLPNGKLLKRNLREAYWGAGRVRI